MSETVGLQHRPIVICGLPGSGKTTFLAALWALVTARDELTTLRFVSLRNGDATHLNAIAARWLSARVQERTPIGSDRLVSMNLEDASRRPVRLTFPDVSGEAYRRMWEDRDCDPAVAEFTASGSVLLFIHTDTIQAPNWVVDFAEISRQIGLPQESTQEVQWHPGLAPTQVQLVGLLQLLHSPPLNAGPRRLAIMLSAWDKAEGEGLSPEAFIAEKLPLLHQYLCHSQDYPDWRAFGVSAQGGDYDPAAEGTPSPDAERLRDLDRPSLRIRLVDGDRESHDLTEPLAWLMD